MQPTSWFVTAKKRSNDEFLSGFFPPIIWPPGAVHVPQPGYAPTGGLLCCPDQWELHGSVLLPAAL